MKRLSSLFLSVALLVGLTTAVEAQNVEAEGGDTTVEIDGKVKTKVFRRDNNINTILNGGTPVDASVPGDPDFRFDEDAQSAMLYHYQLGVTADVGDRVTGRLELENELLDPGRSGSGTGGANANDVALIGEDTSFESTQISEAYVEADRFLLEDLTLTVGIQGYETDLRGDGNPFFLDLQGSEGITDSRATVLEGAASAGLSTDDSRNLNNDAGGIKLTTDINPNTNLDLFWFTVRENTTPVGDNNDEHILGGVLNGSLQDTGSYQLVGTYFQDVATFPGTTAAQGIWTFGGGVEYDVTSAANVYGEGYVQGGDRDDAGSDQETTFALDLGVAGDVGPFNYDVSGTHVSGDDGSDADGDFASGDDNEDFVSYEDNDDTMILEDNVLGLDVDSNYQKVQAIGGVTGTVIRQNDLSVELLGAWAQTEDDIAVPGTDDELDSSLGFETDLTVTWAHSESLDFQVGVARLWSGDFWADDDGFNTTSDALDLYSLTANLNF